MQAPALNAFQDAVSRTPADTQRVVCSLRPMCRHMLLLTVLKAGYAPNTGKVHVLGEYNVGIVQR